VPRGRVLGGSSSINGMFFMRGHSSDFDGWQSLGCEGWSYAHVLPYFKKLESSWRGAVPYHGDSGPMPIAPNATTKLLHEPLMQTAVAAGFWTNEDLNGRLKRFATRRAHRGFDAGGVPVPRAPTCARAASPESRSHAGRVDHARDRGAQAAVGVEIVAVRDAPGVSPIAR
jgi:choline dehydrogenase-like flavoprotein